MEGRSKRGEGYTVRIDGKKLLKTKVLENVVEDAQKQYQELLKENEVLKAKEAEQLKCLEFYETWAGRLHATTAGQESLCPSAEDSTDSSSLPVTARLEKQAQKLKQNLQPAQPSAGAAADTMREAGSAGHISADPAAAASTMTWASTVCDADAAAGSSCSHEVDMMARWMAAVQPEDMAYFKNMTTPELAARLRGIISRLALARRTEGQSTDTERPFEVLEDMGRICAVAVAANEVVMSEVYAMNLETMQTEAMPPGRMAEVVEAVGLSTQQKQAFTNAWQDFADVTAQLMQQQYSTMQQLQAVMGEGVSAPGATSSGPALSAAETAAAASSDAGTPGPAHFMSLATGGAVPAGAGCTAVDAAAAAALLSDAVRRSPIRWDNAETPLSADELVFLTQWLNECKEKPAAAQTSSSDRSNSSSSWLAPAGVLTLQDAEAAEMLMQDLLRVQRAMKRHHHSMTILFVNVLTDEQRADVVLAAYPYCVHVTEFMQEVAQQASQAVEAS